MKSIFLKEQEVQNVEVSPLLHYKPLDIAKQLTLIDWDEYMNCSFVGEEENVKENLLVTNQKASNIGLWFVCEILTCPSVESFITLFVHVVQILRELYGLRNYQSLENIYTSINYFCSSKFSKNNVLKELLPDDNMFWVSLGIIFDKVENYSEELSKKQTPLIPSAKMSTLLSRNDVKRINECLLSPYEKLHKINNIIVMLDKIPQHISINRNADDGKLLIKFADSETETEKCEEPEPVQIQKLSSKRKLLNKLGRESNSVDDLLVQLSQSLSKQEKDLQTLRDLNVFVLDNSIRESTVGQVRGHTLDEKWGIYNAAQLCGFTEFIVGTFSSQRLNRVDDLFVQQLMEREAEQSAHFWSFSELFDVVAYEAQINEIPGQWKKMVHYKLRNIIIEFDGLCRYFFDPKSGKTGKDWEILMLDRIKLWKGKENPDPTARVFVNFRDFPQCMNDNPRRATEIMKFLFSLPKQYQIMGMLFEDSSGLVLPEVLGTLCAYVRKLMNVSGFTQGHLLVHIHERFGFAESGQMECLRNGATGIWCSICSDGAQMGHACSSVALTNLARFGNPHVIKNYNCKYLRKAAQIISKLSTGREPFTYHPIYGASTLDVVFDGGMGGGDEKPLYGIGLDLNEFFQESSALRITALASPNMIMTKLSDYFSDVKCVFQIAYRMIELMEKDMRNNIKEEYSSPAGLAILYCRAGGHVTPMINKAIQATETNSKKAEALILQAKESFYSLPGIVEDEVSFLVFEEEYITNYFPPGSQNSLMVLTLLDTDGNFMISWDEFSGYLKWAVNQFPDEIDDCLEALYSLAFTRAIIPTSKHHFRALAKKKGGKRKIMGDKTKLYLESFNK